MFGYVKPQIPELKVKDYEFYKSIYCGLCKCMGHCTGCISCLSLNYDFVFLAVILLAANEEPFEIKRCRCFAHPLKTRAYMARNKTLEACANLSGLLVYYKQKDDLADTKGIKKAAISLLSPALAYIKKRAKTPPELDEKIKSKLAELSELEKENCASIDTPATLFGEIMEEICAAGIEDKENEALLRIAKSIGYHTGRWIYVADALSDIEKDRKKGNYNPFILTYGENFTEENKKGILVSLSLELAELEKAVNLLSFSDRELIKNLIENVLYLGMPAVSEKQFEKSGSDTSKREETTL